MHSTLDTRELTINEHGQTKTVDETYSRQRVKGASIDSFFTEVSVTTDDACSAQRHRQVSFL